MLALLPPHMLWNPTGHYASVGVPTLCILGGHKTWGTALVGYSFLYFESLIPPGLLYVFECLYEFFFLVLRWDLC